uniref:Secreted protein n=1 Tax=Steinernema glaseri TaxID=37863 RepID=A0A1I7YLU3_9BILA
MTPSPLWAWCLPIGICYVSSYCRTIVAEFALENVMFSYQTEEVDGTTLVNDITTRKSLSCYCGVSHIAEPSTHKEK